MLGPRTNSAVFPAAGEVPLRVAGIIRVRRRNYAHRHDEGGTSSGTRVIRRASRRKLRRPFAYEWHDGDARWFRSFATKREFDESGSMRRFASQRSVDP
jgi:hypothetical protein